MRILGIESSCDETAASVVEDGFRLLSNVVSSQIDIHMAYGGVVPEIAARSHIEAILPVIHSALDESKSSWNEIDGIAVTYGAGLIGSLMIGTLTARVLSLIHNKPLYAINHVEGHVYANFITSSSIPGYELPTYQPEFPLLAIIVSGGHTQLVLFKNHFDYVLLGRTRDDAIGEAFDKVAKILGLPYPGGPSISNSAIGADPEFYRLPIAKLDTKYDFSFSGLKTAVLRAAQSEIGEDYSFPSHRVSERLSEAQKKSFSASFQHVAVKAVVDKAMLAFEEFQPKSVVIAGGVASNQELRRQLSERLPIVINYTDPRLCTDNGAMIATLGCFVAKIKPNSSISQVSNPLNLIVKPNLSM